MKTELVLNKEAILKKKINGIVYTLDIVSNGKSIYVDGVKLNDVINDLKKDILSIETGGTVGWSTIDTRIETLVNAALSSIYDVDDQSSLISQVIELKTLINEITSGDNSVINQTKDYVDTKIGIIDDYETVKDYIDKKIENSKDKKAFHLKGTVDYFEDLPNNPEEGDCYIVKYSGSKINGSLKLINSLYFFNGVVWMTTNNGDIDLSPYITYDELTEIREEIDARILKRGCFYVSYDPPPELSPTDLWAEIIE